MRELDEEQTHLNCGAGDNSVGSTLDDPTSQFLPKLIRFVPQKYRYILKLELKYFGYITRKHDSLEKSLVLQKDRRKKKERTTEDEVDRRYKGSNESERSDFGKQCRTRLERMSDCSWGHKSRKRLNDNCLCICPYWRLVPSMSFSKSDEEDVFII